MKSIFIPGFGDVTPKTQLAENFTVEEFFRTTHDKPKGAYIFSEKLWGEFCGQKDTELTRDFKNLKEVARRLQIVRDESGRVVTVTSGWRSKRLILLIYKKKPPVFGYHLQGRAADFTVDGISPGNVRKRWGKLFGGVGCAKTFTHGDIGPRRPWFTY